MLQRRPTLLFAIFLFSFLLRAWNIGADLPHLYNQDEPHHMNIAARFGTGDLNPHDFKYPTLWKYALASVFGVLFALGKLLGMVKTTADFASAFFYSPTIFYLSARLLAAALFAGGSVVLFLIGDKNYNRETGLAAALFLALGPSYFLFGRDATMYSLMVFLVTVGLYYLHEVLRNNQQSNYVLAGLAIGLAVSTSYAAAPVGFLIPVLHFLKPRTDRRFSNLVAGCLLRPAGFFLGSPFFLFDAHKAFGDVFGMSKLHVTVVGQTDTTELGRRADQMLFHWTEFGKNTLFFLDQWAIGTVLIIVSFVLAKSSRQRALVMAWYAPVVGMFILLAKSYHGNFYRYSLAAFIPLIIPAAAGLGTLEKKMPKRARLVLTFLILIPFLLYMGRKTRAWGVIDTRTMAENWLKEHLNPGDVIFMSDPYYCPALTMDKPQVERMLERTRVLNHPRQRYYAALLHGHPGGGYTVYQLRRGLVEVEDLPERTEKALQAQDTLDPVGEGFKALKKAGVKAVVVHGSIDLERNGAWLTEVNNRCTKEISFVADQIQIRGPDLVIYSCAAPKSSKTH